MLLCTLPLNVSPILHNFATMLLQPHRTDAAPLFKAMSMAHHSQGTLAKNALLNTTQAFKVLTAFPWAMLLPCFRAAYILMLGVPVYWLVLQLSGVVPAGWVVCLVTFCLAPSRAAWVWSMVFTANPLTCSPKLGLASPAAPACSLHVPSGDQWHNSAKTAVCMRLYALHTL